MIKIILIVLGVICFFTVCPMVAVSCYIFSRKNYHNFVAHPEKLDHPAYAQWKKPILENMEYLGIELDKEANLKAVGVEGKISAENSKVAVYVIPTNEELVIARDTKALVEKL